MIFDTTQFNFLVLGKMGILFAIPPRCGNAGTKCNLCHCSFNTCGEMSKKTVKLAESVKLAVVEEKESKNLEDSDQNSLNKLI